MSTLQKHSSCQYQPLSNNSLITQIIVLNGFDALLTLYAIRLGVGEANPLMRHLLNYGPKAFLCSKVVFVTTGILVINKILGHSGRRLYLTVAAIYWLVGIWHVYGALLLWGTM